jgi:hypothetical protein
MDSLHEQAQELAPQKNQHAKKDCSEKKGNCSNCENFEGCTTSWYIPEKSVQQMF